MRLHVQLIPSQSVFSSSAVIFDMCLSVSSLGNTIWTIFPSDPDTGSLSFIREAPCPQNVISWVSAYQRLARE